MFARSYLKVIIFIGLEYFKKKSHYGNGKFLLKQAAVEKTSLSEITLSILSLILQNEHLVKKKEKKYNGNSQSRFNKNIKNQVYHPFKQADILAYIQLPITVYIKGLQL